MNNEIERKFFVKKLPDLSKIIPIPYERYFIKVEKGMEERISKIGNKYFYEAKVEISNLECTKEKREITQQEFNKLKENSSEPIYRHKYIISTNPDIAIFIYHGRFEGLIRAEVEFSTVSEANNFKPLEWMGSEITGLDIDRDSKLLKLSSKKFSSFIILRQKDEGVNLPSF